MATKSILQPIQQSKPTILLPFRKPLPAAISQYDLAELALLKKEAREAQEAFAAKEAEIRGMLEGGATVEDGLRTAELQEHFHKNVPWRDVVIRLAGRLNLDGETFWAETLASTKPSRTVSLVAT